jgi:hypothetical protein
VSVVLLADVPSIQISGRKAHPCGKAELWRSRSASGRLSRASCFYRMKKLRRRRCASMESSSPSIVGAVPVALYAPLAWQVMHGQGPRVLPCGFQGAGLCHAASAHSHEREDCLGRRCCHLHGGHRAPNDPMQRKEDDMRKTLTSIAVALALLSGAATIAQADAFPYGEKTTPQQEPSPN